MISQTTIIMPGNSRISAARAGCQAWAGGGRDAIRATDADRQYFLKLALRWLKEEVADCRSVAKGGTTEALNIRVHLLKMHRELEPIRTPAMIREMPEENQKQAEEIWAGVEELYRKLNPPIVLPWAMKEPLKQSRFWVDLVRVSYSGVL